jgi:Putative prokaryotic signal transducing protein
MSSFKRAEFEPVQVAYATNQAEAEMIQGILSEEGIPSMVRRNRGFDVPDMLAAGPRDIVVPPSAAEKAREILGNLAPGPEMPEGKGLIPGDHPGANRADPGETFPD